MILIQLLSKKSISKEPWELIAEELQEEDVEMIKLAESKSEDKSRKEKEKIGRAHVWTPVT